MKLTIQRNELKLAVAGFTKIINGKSHNLPILGCVRFDAGKQVTAQATDLDQFATYQFADAQAEGDGTLVIPFQQIRELAKSKDGEVTLETENNETITIINNVDGHAIRHTVAGLPPGDWPPAGDEIPTRPADQFLPVYRRLAPFASVDTTRRVLNAVYVDVSGKGENNVTLVACDGRRLTCANSLKLPIKAKDGIIVPVTKFLTWAGLGDDASIGVSKEKAPLRMCLHAGPWTYTTKLIDGVFPNWRQVLPDKGGMTHQLVFTDADVDAMRKILPAFPGGEGIELVGTTDGKLMLAGRNAGDKQDATVELTSGSVYTGAGGRLYVNRFFLLDALNAGFRNFGFADAYTPLRADDNSATHVLMPLRSEPPKPTPVPESAPEPNETVQSVQPTPAAETPPETPKENTVNEKTESKPEPTALETLQAAFEVAKSKVREASQALADVADAIKLAAKEDRQRRNEVENVRAGLQKLQAIKV